MSSHAVLVTGGRKYNDAERVNQVIKSLPEGTLVIHGKARGADTLAQSAADHHGYPTASIPYFGWLGVRGGYSRNEMMVAVAAALQRDGWKVKVVAFPGGNGTEHCVSVAEDNGLPVQRIHA